MRRYRPDQKYVIQARMLKKANVHVEEDLSKRTRENRAELRKFMRQVELLQLTVYTRLYHILVVIMF